MPNDILSGMLENPEYQKTVQKILQTPRAVRALVDPGLADEAFMSEALQKNLQLRQLGEKKAAFEGKLGLEKEKLDLERNLGLSNTKMLYDLRSNSYKNSVDLAKRENTMSNILGPASVAVSGYGLYNMNKLRDKLPGYYNLLLGE